MNEIRAAISEVTIDDVGDLRVSLAGTSTVLHVPKASAPESLMKLLIGLARASEKPGPAYRTMVAPVDIALERVAMSDRAAVPCLDLQLEPGTYLRILLRPEWLRPLAQHLERLRAVILESSQEH